MKRLSYAQRKRITMYAGLIWAICSLILLLTGLFFQTRLLPDNRTFSTFVGLSSGMMSAGFSIFFQTRRLLHDSERLHRSEIHDMDERNQYISAQAARLAFWVSIVVTYIIAFFALFFSVTLYFFLCISTLIMLVLYLLFYWIFFKISC